VVSHLGVEGRRITNGPTWIFVGWPAVLPGISCAEK
jgi:hypothetical protein